MPSPSVPASNVLPADYVGPERCKLCHEEIFDLWSQHPHSVMNQWATEETVKTCHELGIGRVWMHQSVGQGSTSPEAIAYCKEHGIAVIDRGCPMMFVEPVDWFHKAFRWCKGMHAVPQPQPEAKG